MAEDMDMTWEAIERGYDIAFIEDAICMVASLLGFAFRFAPIFKEIVGEGDLPNQRNRVSFYYKHDKEFLGFC